MDRHAEMIERALMLARTSTHRKFKHGAVIARNRTSLAAATNVLRNRAAIDYHHATTHAEIAVLALVRGVSLGKRSTIYVARVNRYDRPMLSKPCAACWSQLVDSEVSEVVWSLRSGGYEVAKTR